MSAPDCPNRRDLSAYLVGHLPERTAEDLATHVDSCPDCQATLTELDDGEDTLVAGLRCPAPEADFHDEPECRTLVTRLEAFVGESFSISDEPAVLGQLGEYRLLEELGHGAMGTVYKALHTKLDRVVALKVLPKGHMEDDRAIARFEREMKAVGRLSHPHIVQAHDAREVDRTRLLVMEYVEGLDLSELVRHLGRLPIADACELVRQAALGLQCSHEHDLVHRDVKPSNLMLSSEGQLKILDLGLALLRAEQPAGEEMTDTGQAMGTADYMAPEQASDSHTVDIRADIYGLGCTLYQLLAGQAPFTGPKYRRNFEKMMGHARDPIPPIRLCRPDVPDRLAAVLNRMLAKDPAERFAVPADVADALGPLCTGCDLPGLLARVEGKAKSPAKVPEALAPTDEFHSSALAGTQPSTPSRRRYRELSARLNVGKVGCGLVVTVGCLLVAVTVFTFQSMTLDRSEIARLDAQSAQVDKAEVRRAHAAKARTQVEKAMWEAERARKAMWEAERASRDRDDMEKLEVAQRLLEAGRKGKQNRPEQFAMLNKAMDLATDGGSAELLLEAAAAIEAEFDDVNVSEIKRTALAKLVRTAPDPSRIGSVAEPADQVMLGDAYWDLAQTEEGEARDALMLGAGHWYKQAEPNVMSAQIKGKLTKRLEEIAQIERRAAQGLSEQAGADAER